MRLHSLLVCSIMICVSAGGCADGPVAPSSSRVSPRAPDAALALPQQLAPPAPHRRLVQTVHLELQADSVEVALGAVREVVQARAAVLSEVRVAGEDGDRKATITLRVPSDQLEAAVGALKQLGRVASELTETTDVTRAYTDLETRLRVKHETTERLQELVRTRTGNVADVLAVERELERLVTEIEHLEGERRSYDQDVALSRITLDLYEPGARPGPIVRAFHSAATTLAWSVSWLVYLVVFVAPWLLLAVVCWLLLRRVTVRRSIE